MMSPVPSMPKPVTGLPVFLIPSTTRLVQPSSMPMTTQAATLGLAPVPIIERQDEDVIAYPDAAVLTPPAGEPHVRPAGLAVSVRLRGLGHGSPPLGLEIMDVDVLALLDVGHRLADVMAVFPHGVARLDVGERDLVADRHVHLRGQSERGIVRRDHARHGRAGLEALDDDDADGVLLLVHQQLRGRHSLPPDQISAQTWAQTWAQSRAKVFYSRFPSADSSDRSCNPRESRIS